MWVINMIFTLILWAIGIFLFLSDRNNKTNRWFAYCYLIASLGTLKEFFIDEVAPSLVSRYPQIEMSAYVTVNSCITAFIYIFSPFCFITLSMYFCNLNKSNKKVFVAVQLVTALIIIIYLLIYSPAQFKYYQLYRIDFWYCMSAYNVGYAIIGSFIMFRNIKKETAYEIKRRKRITCEVLLLPYYYCLVTIFIIHTLNFNSLKKVWKGNIYLVAAILIFYVFIAYKEGFMGVKISFVRYDWNSEMESVNSSTQYINHMLKNHVTKINWSVDSIRKKFTDNQLEEFDIIERSTKQLISFTEKTNKSLSRKLAGDDLCYFTNLIYEALEAFSTQQKGCISVDNNDDVLIVCDPQSIVEVIHNIVLNALEAISQNGSIKISSYFKKKNFCIEITDNGVGITDEQMKQIFKPFYTSKRNSINFGMGLPYCKNVMQAHEGSIEVSSDKDAGTIVVLQFPLKRIKRKELLTN